LTPYDLTYKKLSIRQLEQLQERYNHAIRDIYPLTPMQEGMLFHSLLEEQSAVYFEQLSYRLHGEMDAALVESSLNRMFKRYDVLRTAFIHEGFDRPLQVVLAERTVEFHFEDIRAISAEDKERFIREYKENDRKRAFDLSKDVLMRIAVTRLDESEYEFTWSNHHILLDGWCISTLMSDFFYIYNSLINDREYSLSPVKPYRTYIEWLEEQDREVSKTFWNRYLEGFEEPSLMGAVKRKQPVDKGYARQSVICIFDDDLTRSLNNLATRNQVTLNTLIRSTWGILLGKYTAREDVAFGAVVSGRPSEIEDIESMVGLFINTIPVRIRYEKDTSFKELLQRVQDDVIESETHHYYPLAAIQAESTLKQNLMDHILVFENYPIEEKVDDLVESGGKQAEGMRLNISNVEVFGQTNYDFYLIIIPGTELMVPLIYNENAYETGTIERIGSHFKTIAAQIAANEEIRFDEITLLPAEEKKQLLYEFNNTETGYPAEKTIHRLFEEQAERTPDSIALSGEAPGVEPVTYRELNEKSGRLAARLRARGVGTGTVAAVM
ncbi:MAG: non-ribosomal peptide synthetase, partial [bacterium]|nr:non-ribosomal peptide synthetase [bacterium]